MKYPPAAALLLIATSAAYSEDSVRVCYNWGCSVETEVALTRGDLRTAARLFIDVRDAASERAAVRQAIAVLANAAARATPIANDLPGNSLDYGVDGRMDCIDHSRTTSEYLRLFQRRHWLRFHRVRERVMRAPLFVNVHWAALIEERDSSAQFVVDTWFRPNGAPAEVFELDAWRRGAVPPEYAVSPPAPDES